MFGGGSSLPLVSASTITDESMKASFLEQIALAIIKDLKLPLPITEHQFDDKRKWRFDLAWPDRKIAVEIEGGHGGRHQRFYGYANDCEKYNQATILGWRVYRFTGEQIKSGYFDSVLKDLFKDGRGQ